MNDIFSNQNNINYESDTSEISNDSDLCQIDAIKSIDSTNQIVSIDSTNSIYQSNQIHTANPLDPTESISSTNSINSTNSTNSENLSNPTKVSKSFNSIYSLNQIILSRINRYGSSIINNIYKGFWSLTNNQNAGLIIGNFFVLVNTLRIYKINEFEFSNIIFILCRLKIVSNSVSFLMKKLLNESFFQRFINFGIITGYVTVTYNLIKSKFIFFK